jgi:O-antigen ligase
MFWFYASLLGAFQVGVLLTGSRGATVASAVAWLFLPWVFVRLKVYKKGAAVALLAGLVTAALAIVPPTTWQRLGETGTEIQTGSFSRRGPIWQAGWEVFQNNPIAGIGAGAFNASVAGKLVGATAPHNVFLAVGVEMGLVGLALLAGLLLCLFLGCRQLPRFERRLALILMMTWGMASMASNCEYKKETWLVFGLLSVQVGNRLRMGMEVRRSSATIDEKGFAY